jgi:hypothetical protein
MKLIFEIAAYKKQNVTHYEPCNDVYKFQKNCKLKWLQKICFFILEKLKANYIGSVVEVSITKIDTQEVLEKIFNEYQIPLVFFTHKRCTHILAGRDVFYQIKREVNDTFGFFKHDCIAIESLEKTPYMFQTLKYMNLTIICIPWMEGVLPLPGDVLTNNIHKGETNEQQHKSKL